MNHLDLNHLGLISAIRVADWYTCIFSQLITGFIPSHCVYKKLSISFSFCYKSILDLIYIVGCLGILEEEQTADDTLGE